MVHIDSKSSNTFSHDTDMTTKIPLTITPFDITSTSFTTTFNCAKNMQGGFSLTSIMKIDGPATQALEQTIRLSKRRFASDDNSTAMGGCLTESIKKNKLCKTVNKEPIALMSDWNDVYNSLLSSVPVDGTKPTIMNEPFPDIEYTFDEPDNVVHDSSRFKRVV